jgi:putative ABC transport system permease protein
VTSAFFREAKVAPMVGRLFLDKEYQIADARAVVIAASFWQRRFGGDPALVGKALSVNQQQRTVVGILPRTFQFPTDAELWMPQNW